MAFQAAPRARRARILVVDDDASLRTVLAGALESQGYELEAFSAGSEALARLAHFKPCDESAAADLAITDLKMEPMGGLALLREIQAHDHRVTTIVMTARGTIESAVEAMRLGAFDYILKPFAFEEMNRVVSTALETHRRRSYEVYLPTSLTGAKRCFAGFHQRRWICCARCPGRETCASWRT